MDNDLRLHIINVNGPGGATRLMAVDSEEMENINIVWNKEDWNYVNSLILPEVYLNEQGYYRQKPENHEPSMRELQYSLNKERA